MPSPARTAPRRLSRYVDGDGRHRELIARPGAGGSLLVLDRDATTLCDERLVAHLGPEEPAENAVLVCRLYMEDASGRWCRALTPQDLETVPGEEEGARSAPGWVAPGETCAGCEGQGAWCLRHEGRCYRLMPFPDRDRDLPQLRWASQPANGEGPWRPLSLRDVLERWERYEPIWGLTARACEGRCEFGQANGQPARVREGRCEDRRENGLTAPVRVRACAGGHAVSVTTLAAELGRLRASAMVLNRGLREAVLEAVNERGLSLGEISLRCGMARREPGGRLSGETSWLARRVGLMSHGGGNRRAARWVHSDVLALIARQGLGVSPREVEVQ